MKLKKTTILEPGEVMKKEYGYEMNYSDLEKLAYSLVGYIEADAYESLCTEGKATGRY